MNKKYMLDAKNLCASTENVKEVLYTKSVSLSVILCLVGFGIILLSSWIEDKSSAAYMGSNTLAIVLLIVGFYRLLYKCKKMIYVPTSSTMLNGSFYLEGKQLEAMKVAISTNSDDVNYNQFKFIRSGNVRLDYVVSSDGYFVAVQLFEYVPYNFEPVSEVITYENDKAHGLAMLLLKNHGKV